MYVPILKLWIFIILKSYFVIKKRIYSFFIVTALENGEWEKVGYDQYIVCNYYKFNTPPSVEKWHMINIILIFKIKNVISKILLPI